MDVCAGCGIELALIVGEREPCPKCGSLNRIMMRSVADTITMRDELSFVQTDKKPTGGKRMVAKGSAGLRKQADGTWAFVDSLFDWRRNRRREYVRLADGTVKVDVDHPLTEHQGHGSAKFSPKDDE